MAHNYTLEELRKFVGYVVEWWTNMPPGEGLRVDGPMKGKIKIRGISNGILKFEHIIGDEFYYRQPVTDVVRMCGNNADPEVFFGNPGECPFDIFSFSIKVKNDFKEINYEKAAKNEKEVKDYIARTFPDRIAEPEILKKF